ncbi:hypothetical protein AWB69_03875 [Caballeronia udeis]|uniref:Uncharacterized protein n=1 Tax=Caballeronia udeis TaxID=1232866 RepID=A0A158H5A6_9BURK|nr:hypothetical protein [Caballeronia udeis]SAL39251.1 hypothetical protein AWB69_03875 [Caballeronia udeis]
MTGDELYTRLLTEPACLYYLGGMVGACVRGPSPESANQFNESFTELHKRLPHEVMLAIDEQIPGLITDMRSRIDSGELTLADLERSAQGGSEGSLN